MSVVHLATLDGTLCESNAARPVTSNSIHPVTCKRCSRRLDTLNADGWGAVRERQCAERNRAAAEFVGLDSVLDFLATQGDSAYVRMTSGLIESLAVYLDEMGYTKPPPAARILAAEPEASAAA